MHEMRTACFVNPPELPRGAAAVLLFEGAGASQRFVRAGGNPEPPRPAVPAGKPAESADCWTPGPLEAVFAALGEAGWLI